MMTLPALDPHERACLLGSQPDRVVGMFAARLEKRLFASLGVPIAINELPVGEAQGLPAGDEPMIEIRPELASAWLGLRLGGKPAATMMSLKDARLSEPFRNLVRRTLAESVVNAGAAAWPRLMRLQLAMGGQQGSMDIAWNSAHALAWAHRVIREKR